jgi:hypothetical protein
MGTGSEKVRADKAARLLAQMLGRQLSGLQTVGVAEDSEGPFLIAYFSYHAKVPHNVVPRTFDGFRVRLRKIRQIRPASTPH